MSENVHLDASGDPAEHVGLSPAAASRVRALLAREKRPESAGVRVAVVNGGCSGMSYTLGLADAPQENDLVSEVEGVRVFVDGPSLQYLDGLVVDFVESLHGGGFKFLNPNADRTCGCGSSFSV